MAKGNQISKKVTSLKDSIVMPIMNMNLRNKLMLSYVVVLVIPIICMSLYIFSTFSKENNIKITRDNQQAVEGLRNKIEYNIQKCIMDSNLMIKKRELLYYFYDSSIYSVQQLLDFKYITLNEIQSIPTIDPDINNIRFFVSNPDMYEIFPNVFNIRRIKKYSCYKDIFTNRQKSVWDMPHTEDVFHDTAETKNKVVSYYSGINSLYGNKPIGICEVNMNAQNFFSSMFNIKGNEKFMCVISDKSKIYFDSDNGFIKKQRLNYDYIKSVLLAKTKKSSGNFIAKLGGVRISVAYDYVNKLNSYIYAVTSTERTLSEIYEFRNEVLFGTVGLIIIFIVIIYIITSAVLNKLEVLVDCMRSVQKGDLDIDIPIRGKDEIGEVGYHFKKMLDRLRELISTIVKKEALTKDAEIRALQTQINAHFLYNALETIKMMAVIDYKYEIADALTILGSIMRYSISWSKKYVLFEEEINHIKNYVQLLNLRYDNGIELKLNIEEKLKTQEILKMTIQPIVENAVNYGIDVKGHNGVIIIDAYRDGNLFYIKVTDDGVGMTPDEIQRLNLSIQNINDDSAKDIDKSKDKLHGHNGIGLKNVNQRIKIFYGDNYGIEVMSEIDKYTSVVIKLPYSKAFEGALDSEKSINC